MMSRFEHLAAVIIETQSRFEGPKDLDDSLSDMWLSPYAVSDSRCFNSVLYYVLVQNSYRAQICLEKAYIFIL